MFVACVCVCVCVSLSVALSAYVSIAVCVAVYLCLSACLCLSVWVWEAQPTWLRSCCVSVCDGKRAGDGEAGEPVNTPRTKLECKTEPPLFTSAHERSL